MLEDPLIWQLFLQIILIMMNAIFACAEIAIISTNDNKLSLLASQGDKRATRLVYLTSQPARFLSTIQVGITLAGFLGSAFAADNFADRLMVLFPAMAGSNPALLRTICVVIVTLVLSYFTLIFGELVPKRVAMRKAEALALSMSGFIYVISKLFAPIVWLLTISTNAILRLLGIDPNDNDEEVTEEEIRMMVDAGSEKGTIDEVEKEMIQNIFEFDDLCAEDAMTHRTDCTILWKEDSDEVWSETIRQSRHTFYPICEDSVDNIIGILNVKEYFRLNDRSRSTVLAKAVKRAYFVPETVKLDALFRNMQKSKNHFAVVLDDYGGMSGVITMNDLLEQLVGSLEEPDDADVSEASLKEIGENQWQLNGYVFMDDLTHALKYNLDEEDCETFGSYVFSNLGSIPDDGSQLDITIGRMQIKILKIKDHCIEDAILTLLPDLEEEEEE